VSRYSRTRQRRGYVPPVPPVIEPTGSWLDAIRPVVPSAPSVVALLASDLARSGAVRVEAIDATTLEGEVDHLGRTDKVRIVRRAKYFQLAGRIEFVCSCGAERRGLTCAHLIAVLFQHARTLDPKAEIDCSDVGNQPKLVTSPPSETPSAPEATKPEKPSWKTLLDRAVGRSLLPQARGFEVRAWKPEPLSDLVLIIDIERSVAARLLILCSVGCRPTAQMRKPSWKTLDLSTSFGDRESLIPEYRLTMAEIEGLNEIARSSWGRNFPANFRNGIDWAIPPGQTDGVMRRLIERGRAAWRSELSDVREFRRLPRDHHGCGSVEFRIVRDEDERTFSLRGFVLEPRFGERPLESAILVLPDGGVLWQDGWTGKIGPETGRWIAAAWQTPVAPMSIREAQQFVRTWRRTAGAPKLVVGPELGLEVVPEPVVAPLVPKPVVVAETFAEKERTWQLTAQLRYGERLIRLSEPRDTLRQTDGSEEGFRRADPAIEIESFDAALEAIEAARPIAWGALLRPDDWTQACNRLVSYDGRPIDDDTRTDRSSIDRLTIVTDKRLLPTLVKVIDAGYEVLWNKQKIRAHGRISISVSSGIDWFDVDANADFDGVMAETPALLEAIASNSSLVRLSDGSVGFVDPEALKRLARLADSGEKQAVEDGEGGAIRFRGSQMMLLDALLEADAASAEFDTAYLERRERLRQLRGIGPADPVAGFQGNLRDYQRSGLGWLRFLRDHSLGGCLADDMGLGKTVQVLALLEERRQARLADPSIGPSLCVVPKSLLFNWRNEASRFAPELRVLVSAGTDRHESLGDLSAFDLIITTYATLTRDIQELRQHEFDYVVLDEAQAIKNASTLASKACRLLKARHRLALSGTPIENHLGELWSLFEFLNPGMLGRASSFERMAGSRTDLDVLPIIGKAVAPFVLRRTKRQVLTELPEKSQVTLTCQLGPKQRKLYDQLRKHYRDRVGKSVRDEGEAKTRFMVLEALLRLRQAACHPGLIDPTKGADSAKFDALLERLPELIDEGHKALIFSQFTSLFDLLRPQLDKAKIRYEYLDGKTNDRQQRVDRFQNSPDIPLFLISLKAGGHGLNLTAADYVFLLDPWWNPAVEAQAIDRAHRMGQTRPVFAYRLIAADTIEEKIAALQESKRQLADAVISENDGLLGKMTFEDLRALLD
jgi:superfamily II DNA or RNA helicase